MPDPDRRPTLRGYIAAQASRAADVRRRALARVARWHQPVAAAIAVTLSLIAHEVGYHLSGGQDFPLTVLAGDTRILVISHGGLDALGVGLFAVAVIAFIDTARAYLAEHR